MVRARSCSFAGPSLGPSFDLVESELRLPVPECQLDHLAGRVTFPDSDPFAENSAILAFGLALLQSLVEWSDN
jgi:hypothetical protein